MEPRLAGIGGRQLRQCGIKCQNYTRRCRATRLSRSSTREAAPLCGLAGAGVVDERAAHHLTRHTVKLAPIRPIDTLAS